MKATMLLISTLSSLYADTFMLEVSRSYISEKRWFFKMFLKDEIFCNYWFKKTTLVSFEEVRLDDEYNMVKWHGRCIMKRCSSLSTWSSANILFSQIISYRLWCNRPPRFNAESKELGLTWEERASRRFVVSSNGGIVEESIYRLTRLWHEAIYKRFDDIQTWQTK